jgi:hypothetical protein
MIMKRYDPLRAPDAAEWLELDEGERIVLVRKYHRRAGVKLPSALAHAVIHAVVETQIAMGDELPVRRTVDRLQADGLARHEAIHAVGTVLAEHMHALMTPAPREMNPNEPYWRSLEKLTAETWRRSR